MMSDCLKTVAEYNSVLLAACESILGGAGMRLEDGAWPSYLELNEGPPKVAARSSFGETGSATGTCDCAWIGGKAEAVAGPRGDQSCGPEVDAYHPSSTYLLLLLLLLLEKEER